MARLAKEECDRQIGDVNSLGRASAASLLLARLAASTLQSAPLPPLPPSPPITAPLYVYGSPSFSSFPFCPPRPYMLTSPASFCPFNMTQVTCTWTLLLTGDLLIALAWTIRYSPPPLDDHEEDSQSDLSASATETSSLVTVRAGCCSFNPVSRTGKRWHQLQMVTLPFIPIAALIIQNCILVANVVTHQNEINTLGKQVDGTVELGMLLTALQLERAEVAYFIFSNGTKLSSSEVLARDVNQLKGELMKRGKRGGRWLANTPRGSFGLDRSVVMATVASDSVAKCHVTLLHNIHHLGPLAPHAGRRRASLVLNLTFRDRIHDRVVRNTGLSSSVQPAEERHEMCCKSRRWDWEIAARFPVSVVQTNLDDTFRRTDTILEKVHSWPKFNGGNMQLLSSKLRFQIRLEDLRKSVNDADDSVGEKMVWYNYITFFVMEAIVSNIKDATISSVWK
ncbi:hypothetical protein O3P69_000510 [Scylla paramamosain]|uniref:Uncharacterized protein n=1 Tax=Scylla paramamosain TaxID=85552 RepID=A0AAW0UTK5_SCYPA